MLVVIKMGGEHFTSDTGKDLEKTKDVYVRFRWETKKKEKRPRQTILEKKKIDENKDLSDWLAREYHKSANSCVLCQEAAKWPLIRVEFYNWEKEKTESEIFVHEGCLKNMWPKMASLIEGLRLMGKNPTFLPQLDCTSAAKCGFVSKSNDFRNCEHIALRFEVIHENNSDGTVTVHMAPVLYCKRAHPGEVSLPTEAETYWNVEDAGLTLMVSRMTESLHTPGMKAAIEAIRKQNPALVEQVRKGLADNPFFYSMLTPGAMLLVEALIALPPDPNLYPLALCQTTALAVQKT